jgi:hypothetical protein
MNTKIWISLQYLNDIYLFSRQKTWQFNDAIPYSSVFMLDTYFHANIISVCLFALNNINSLVFKHSQIFS